MSAATVTRSRLSRLPEELQVAQKAIELPEVKEMLRKLSRYNLGIFMPHMHDEQTGEFKTLPPGMAQVEDGLVVSFRPQEECLSEGDTSYITVGWFLHPERMSDDDPDLQRCVSRCRLTDNDMHEPHHPRS